MILKRLQIALITLIVHPQILKGVITRESISRQTIIFSTQLREDE